MNNDILLGILYLILILGFVAITVYLCIALNQATRVMKNVERTSKRVDNVADVVETATTEGVAPVVNGIVSLIGKAAGYVGSMMNDKQAEKTKKRDEK
jgi:hypothetical protein